MADERKKANNEGIEAIVDRMISDAITYDNTELSNVRRLALDFAEGKVDVPAEDGRSRVVSHDLADTMGWMLPNVLRVFLSTDRVVIYEPRRADAVEDAKQATDYINYVFLTECDGYKVLHSALYDGFLVGNGVVKHWWDDTKEYKEEQFTGLTDAEVQELQSDPHVVEFEDEAYPDPNWVPPLPVMAPTPLLGPQLPEGSLAGMLGAGPMPPAPPMPSTGLGALLPQSPMPMLPSEPPSGPPMLHDVKLKRVISPGRIRVAAVPSEEFLIERRATELSEDKCRFVAHRYMSQRSHLIDMGYRRKDVEAIPAADNLDNNQERLARESYNFLQSMSPDKSVDLVEVYECYVKVDAGDGSSEWRKVVRAGADGGRKTLSDEVWEDALPFTDLVPNPIPHRWRGRSLFDEVYEIQRIKTVLWRQSLDNLYMTNNPRTEVVDGQVINLDELVNQELGANIFVKAPNAIRTLDVPFTAKESFGMLDYTDTVLERRTGASRNSQGLVQDALKDQTATAVNAAVDATYLRKETYARNIANVGLPRLFKALLKLAIKHQDQPKVVRLTGKFVEMNPSAWDADMDVTINTGLGTGARDRDMAALMGIKATQEQIIGKFGPMNPLCGVKEYRNTLAKMCEAYGIRSVELFFKDPSDEELQAFAHQPKPPDPHMAAAQAKMQEGQAKLQLEQQKFAWERQKDTVSRQDDLQLKQQDAAMNAKVRSDQANADLQIKLQEMDRQQALDIEKMNREFMLKRQELQLEAQLQAQRMMMPGSHAQANIQQELM